MNKYESVIIINPNLEAEAIKSLIEKISNLINTDGKVSSVIDRNIFKRWKL